MWAGSIEAQRQADEAYRKLRPNREVTKVHKRKNKTCRRKKKRRLPKSIRGMNYREYINSPHWKKKRAEFIESVGGRCERCGSTKQLQVHHKHYRTLKRESKEDVEVLCKECHELEHEEKGVTQTNELAAEFQKIIGKA